MPLSNAVGGSLHRHRLVPTTGAPNHFLFTCRSDSSRSDDSRLSLTRHDESEILRYVVTSICPKGAETSDIHDHLTRTPYFTKHYESAPVVALPLRASGCGRRRLCACRFLSLEGD